jgi:hypothetical protein
MALAYIASLSIPSLAPSVWLSVGNVSAGLSASLTGNLALAAKFTATPPTIATQLAASAQVSADIAAAILAIPPALPTSFTLSDLVSLQASISASLNVYLPALLDLLNLNAGIYSYSYAGIGSSLGAAVTTELATTWPDGAPTSADCTALIFGAVSPVAQAALPGFLSGLTYGTGLVYTGKIGLTPMVPLVVGAAAQAEASLSAQAAAAASIKVPAIPVTFEGMAAAQAKFYANIKAVGAISSPALTISTALSAAAKLQANFGASCQLGAALTTGATLFVYEYTGPANAMGAALTTALASTWGDTVTPSNTACVATLLAGTDALSIATLLGFFGGAV